MGTQAKPDQPKTCESCGQEFTRRRFGARLEDRTRFLSRRFCSQSCGNSRPEVTKSALHWRARKHRLPTCQECATPEGLHVHHIDRDPSNNDPANLATLCGSCHLRLHWREDRVESTGVRTPRRSTAGSES